MRRFSIGMTLLGAMLATPLLAHHMAEGIISPDLWENIDDRLEDSNSQHNEMLEITGTVMDVVTDDDTGIIFLPSYPPQQAIPPLPLILPSSLSLFSPSPPIGTAASPAFSLPPSFHSILPS